MKRFLFFGALFVFFAAVLVLSPSLSHDGDDEMIYASLAAKIASKGLSSYNLREVSIEPAGVFWRVAPSAEGNVLALLSKSGVGYYDTALYFNPPLFPALLAASHTAFDGTTSFLVLKRGSPRSFHREQLTAALLQALSGSLLLWGIAGLGRAYFSETAGIWAAVFCASSPVFLICVFKTWSDVAAAAFLTWSFLLWRRREGEGRFDALLSGFLFGLAVLTRTASLFMVPVFLTLRWKRFLIWSAAAVLVTFPWFFALFKVHGSPFFFPGTAQAREDLEWFRSLSRPWVFYLADLLFLSPVFALAALALRKETFRLWAWALCFIGTFSFLLYSPKPLGLEDRYLLPAYPALCLLAALGLEKLRPRLLVLFPIAWSLTAAWGLVLSRESLKFVPF